MRHDQVGTFVATRLKALREARGYSVRKLAHRSDITPEMLSRAERGERLPSIETLAKVCTGLQLTLSQFFDAGEAATPAARDAAAALLPLEPRAREHFLDAIRSIERGMEAAAAPIGSTQRRRKKPAPLRA